VNELIIFILSFDTYIEIKRSIVNAVPLNNLTIFSLPGGLWVFCATTLSQAFYIKLREYKMQVALVPILFATGLEFCQLIQVCKGTFDIWDIAFYLTFWLLAYYSFHAHALQQNILSPFTLHGFICLACFLSVYLAHVSE
jgi:hypothetical protein